MILHFQPVENSNFEKFVFDYKDEMNKISLNEFKENYKNYHHMKRKSNIFLLLFKIKFYNLYYN